MRSRGVQKCRGRTRRRTVHLPLTRGRRNVRRRIRRDSTPSIQVSQPYLTLQKRRAYLLQCCARSTIGEWQRGVPDTVPGHRNRHGEWQECIRSYFTARRGALQMRIWRELTVQTHRDVSSHNIQTPCDCLVHSACTRETLPPTLGSQHLRCLRMGS